LIVAIPPTYQQFWIQKNKVVRSPASRKQIPQAIAVGFEFFMPDFSGYTPQNYKDDFDEDRVQVVSIEPVEPRTDGLPPAYSDIDGAIRRLAGVAFIPSKFDEMNGLRCFASPRNDERRICAGKRTDEESLLLDIVLPPYPAGVSFPLMRTTYYTKSYGGLKVTWWAHMKHFPRWLEIDRQIWRFIGEWNISK
jgi:hypothetical protein